MKHIIGIDEVGRGPWAGPLVAVAVELCGKKINGLADSKQISRGRREQIVSKICQTAAQIGIGWVAAVEIDELGLTKATSLAMKRALRQITVIEQEIIVDGHIDYLAPDYKCRAIIKADQSVPAVSAASIVAKVARDHYMQALAALHPEYGFEAHVGYGTPGHLQALQTYGVSWLHRLSFAPVAKLITA